MNLSPNLLPCQAVAQWACCAAVAMSLATAVSAQSLRDPTVAPAAAGLVGDAAPTPEETLKPGSISVLKRDGVHYLMLGTRLYGVGQRIGQVRVERIAETEVWLREAGQLKKIQVFSGVQRRAALAPQAPKKSPVAPVLVRPAQNTP